MTNIGFIGMGKVGSALAAYFDSKGLVLNGFYTLNNNNLSPIISSLDFQNYDTLKSLVESSEYIFITTQDTNIKEVAIEISKLSVSIKSKTILHCSGALSSEILDSCADKGANVYTIHPLQAFSGGLEDIAQLDKTFLTIEGPDFVYNKINQDILAPLGNPYLRINKSDKPLYHAAAVMLSNYMVTLVEEGLSYLKKIGFDEDTAISMMMPLMTGTLANISMKGSKDSLTGPIKRGDYSVVAKHISVIHDKLGNDSANFYKYIGMKTLALTKNTSSYDTTSNLFIDLLKE